MYWMTSDMKSLTMSGAAALVGMAQVFYTRQNGFPMLPPIAMLGPVAGDPKVYGNVGLGAAAVALAYMGKTKGKFITNDTYQNMLFFYGLTTIFGGVWNYFFPGIVAAPAGMAFQLPSHKWANVYQVPPRRVGGMGRIL